MGPLYVFRDKHTHIHTYTYIYIHTTLLLWGMVQDTHAEAN